MTWEELLAYCLSKQGAWQDEPWEGDVVAKVGPKIFAFLGSGEPLGVGLKCGASRESADEWLLRYPGDAAAEAYIGRSGWNRLRIGGIRLNQRPPQVLPPRNGSPESAPARTD